MFWDAGHPYCSPNYEAVILQKANIWAPTTSTYCHMEDGSNMHKSRGRAGWGVGGEELKTCRGIRSELSLKASKNYP